MLFQGGGSVEPTVEEGYIEEIVNTSIPDTDSAESAAKTQDGIDPIKDTLSELEMLAKVGRWCTVGLIYKFLFNNKRS